MSELDGTGREGREAAGPSRLPYAVIAAELAEARREGLTIRQIAEELGRSRSWSPCSSGGTRNVTGRLPTRRPVTASLGPARRAARTSPGREPMRGTARTPAGSRPTGSGRRTERHERAAAPASRSAPGADRQPCGRARPGATGARGIVQVADRG